MAGLDNYTINLLLVLSCEIFNRRVTDKYLGDKAACAYAYFHCYAPIGSQAVAIGVVVVHFLDKDQQWSMRE